MKKLFVLFIMMVSLVSSLSAKSYPVLKSLDGIVLLDNVALGNIFKVGTTIEGTNLKFKKEVVQHYRSDFKYDGTVASGKKKISGVWLIENNMICHIFNKKNKNKKKCRSVYKSGQDFFELNKKNMKIIMKFKITKN